MNIVEKNFGSPGPMGGSTDPNYKASGGNNFIRNVITMINQNSDNILD